MPLLGFGWGTGGAHADFHHDDVGLSWRRIAWHSLWVRKTRRQAVRAILARDRAAVASGRVVAYPLCCGGKETGRGRKASWRGIATGPR